MADVAFITGSATGIGAEVSRQLTAVGVKVAACDINEAAGNALVAELGGQFIRCDVMDFESVERAVAECIKTLGVPKYAHLNAGVMTVGPDEDFLAIEDVPLETFQRIMDVNFAGVFHGLKALLPHMRNNGGAITVSSSVAGIMSFSPDPLYAATKAALISLVRSVAVANEESNIRVNAICPGAVDTAIMPHAFRAEVAMMPTSTIAAEIIDLLQNGANGEVRVKLTQEEPAFTVDPMDPYE